MTDETFFLLLCGLLIAALPFAWWCRRQARQDSLQWQELEEAQRRLRRAKCEALEADLLDWLGTLGLPQLADQTKRQAAARQLCTVLVARLAPWLHRD